MAQLNTKLILGIGGWVIIYTAIVLGAGFYSGNRFANHQNSDTNAKVQAAVKAAAPAPVAVTASKN